jgi:phage gp37-like protein
MATQFKIADVEQGLIALLQADAGLAALTKQVQGLSSKQWDEQGNILVIPPAVLVFFEGGSDTGSGDTVRMTYDAEYMFAIICGATDLSSTDKERAGAYALLGAVRAALAGQRVQVDGGSSSSFPLKLAGITLEQFDANGAWYTQRVLIGKTAQFG